MPSSWKHMTLLNKPPTSSDLSQPASQTPPVLSPHNLLVLTSGHTLFPNPQNGHNATSAAHPNLPPRQTGPRTKCLKDHLASTLCFSRVVTRHIGQPGNTVKKKTVLGFQSRSRSGLLRKGMSSSKVPPCIQRFFPRLTLTQMRGR
eukprot:Protomagalhaensia_sp_Gyna_25__1142@NODE_1560_length_1731_cov_3_168440_g1267_i0_p2_GENE_NODE_1560_length_1731_cov_3_168440_g1267_i0NODE_1560_length_1731_cov_3_168440_g1267_i0_p2_ORF_typecomplete_len146_score8_92PRACH/PF01502_18/0_14_NODE_1560_length_1731_cov_3_168440_g1267_i07231160